MTRPIRAVIFDLGRVLVDFDHLIAAKKISSLIGRPAEEIYDLFFDSRVTREFEEGRIGAEEFFRQVKLLLDLSISFEEFSSIWNSIFFINEHNRQVYALAKRLRATHNTILLSNINELHFRHIEESFPILDAFDLLIPSFRYGCIKPDKRIYEKTLELAHIEPDEAFYTDDRPELIAQARNLGIRGFVYTGFDQLLTDLLSCGIRAKNG